MGKLLGRVKENARELKNKSFIKKTILTTCLGMGVALGSVYADSLDSSFVEVYHVYVNQEHIGTVDSKGKVEQFIKSKEKNAESNLDHIDLIPEQEITYIREIAFTPKNEIKQVKNSLEDTLTFNASAIKLKLEDQVIGYVEDLEAANKAINHVVSKYLPDGISQDFKFLKKENNQIKKSSLFEPIPSNVKNEAKKQSHENAIKLSDGSLVLDIGLTENIKFTQVGVDPTKLLTVEQLEQLLERGTRGKKVHTIEKNEVLSEIAVKYDLSMDELLDLNPELEKESIVQVGQKVYVEDEKPIIDVTYTIEKEVEESIDYKTITKSTDDLYKGQTRIDKPGQEGVKLVKYRVTTKNNEVINKEKLSEKVIKEPVKQVVLKGTKIIPSRGTGQFTWPTVGGTITSYMGYRWGRMHRGIDISGVDNRTIEAADNGVVVAAGWEGSFGYRIIIDHNNGYKTLYAHLSRIDVSVGQTVRKGQSIGIMGTTGRSTGVHLHFEVEKYGQNINPLDFF